MNIWNKNEGIFLRPRHGHGFGKAAKVLAEGVDFNVTPSTAVKPSSVTLLDLLPRKVIKYNLLGFDDYLLREGASEMGSSFYGELMCRFGDEPTRSLHREHLKVVREAVCRDLPPLYGRGRKRVCVHLTMV